MNKYIYFLLLSFLSIGPISAMQNNDFFDELDELSVLGNKRPYLELEEQYEPFSKYSDEVAASSEVSLEDHPTIPAAASITLSYIKKIVCKNCDSSFKNSSHARDHVIAQHLKILPFKCSAAGCQYSATQASNVTQHIKKTHPSSDLKPIRPSAQEMHEIKKMVEGYLEISEQEEASLEDSTIPVATSATHDKQYACKTCNSSFKRAPTLEDHIISKHLKLHPFLCSATGCQYSATQVSNVTQHIKKAHPSLDLKPIRPSEQEMSELKKQIEKHMDKMPKRRPRTRLADQLNQKGNEAFSSDISEVPVQSIEGSSDDLAIPAAASEEKHQIKEHLQIPEQGPQKKSHVQNGNKYICKTCNAIFFYRGLCEDHIVRYHLQVFPYKCAVDKCYYTGSTRGNVFGHLRNKHRGLSNLKPIEPSEEKMLELKKQIAEYLLIS